MLYGLRLLLLSCVTLVSFAALRAAEFETIWEAVQSHSPSLKSEINEKEASEIEVSRAKGHWLPRLILNAGVLSSNDPGTFLFSTLGSRSLLSTDLSPAQMNEPSRQWFKRGSAGIDWTLFEGGAKQAIVKGAVIAQESRAIAVSARKNEIFADLVRDYGKLASLSAERDGVNGLREKVLNLVDRYKLGSKDNPVGYSGLLGMRSLLNRLDSILAQNAAEAQSLRESLRLRSGLDSVAQLSFGKMNSVEFAKVKLAKGLKESSSSSLRAESVRLMAIAQSEYSQAEKARWLPRLGVYASENLVSGSRNTATSTEYGAYLQWELFNANNLGAHHEATLRSIAFENRANELVENSAIAREGLSSSVPMLEENLKRTRDSMAITAEQVQVTEKLFRDGSVNALQLTEVLSRHADVIESQKQIESILINQLSEAFNQNAGAL